MIVSNITWLLLASFCPSVNPIKRRRKGPQERFMLNNCTVGTAVGPLQLAGLRFCYRTTREPFPRRVLSSSSNVGIKWRLALTSVVPTSPRLEALAGGERGRVL